MKLDNVQDIYPLSPMQRGMLFHAIDTADAGLYVLQLRVTITGPLDFERLREAWHEVVQRHEALRAAFVWEGLDEPLQVIHERVETPFTRVDGLDRSDALDEWMRNDRRLGFKLKEAPLMRVTMLTLGDQEHRLVWTLHHLLADAWSLAVVLRELGATYGARIEGRESALLPAPAYRDFIAWLNEGDPEAAKATWQRYLAGVDQPPALNLPPPASTPHAGARTQGRASHRLSASATQLLKSFARDQGVTLTALYYAAWALTLGRYSTPDDVIFGSVFSGRGHGLPGAERAVGLYINTLPVRVRLDAAQTVAELVQQIHTDLLALRREEHTPLGRIQAWSDLAGGEPLFRTMLVVENHPPLAPADAADPGALVFSDFDPEDQSDFPLSVFVIPGERLQLLTQHDRDLMDDRTAERLLAQFARALESLSTQPARIPAEVPVLTQEEQATLDALARGPALPEPIPDCILAPIAAQLRRSPDKTALVCGDETLGYAALGQRAAAVAEALKARGTEPGDRVALLLERGCEAVACMLGVLLARAAYVPLDIAYPAERIRAVLEDCAAAAVITTPALGERFGVQDRALHPPAEPAAAGLSVFDGPLPTADALAYVLYTSGSTGRPKGVAVEHGNLAWSTAARQAHYGAAPESFLLLSSFAFDSSVAGLFWTLATGGTLVISPPGLEQDVAALCATITRHAVTHTLCLPALYELVLEFAEPGSLATLEAVIVAGAPVSGALVRRHQALRLNARLYNEYGPTEATVWSTVAELTNLAAGVSVPIGRPIPGAEVRLNIDARRAAPLGAPGELWISGPGVARGYLGRSEETREAFVEDANGQRWYRSGDLARYGTDGQIEFLGRRDEQLKIRGHRVETGEIEATLRRHPEVQEACVVLVATAGPGGEDRSQPRALAAFVTHEPPQPPSSTLSPPLPGARSHETAHVSADTLANAPANTSANTLANDAPNTDSHTLEPAALRAFCRETLPEFMVPAQFVVLPSLPRLPNGKVDRNALMLMAGEAAPTSPEDEAPRDELETALGEIWQEVLGVASVGRHDDFFALGGDSLASIRIVALAQAQGIPLAPSELFEYPSIGELAELRRRTAARPSAGGDALYMVHGGQRILEALEAHCGKDRAVHLLRDHRDSGEVAPFASVESLARDYLEAIARLDQDSPAMIGGYSIGAPIAVEMARQLSARGVTPPLVFLLDPPDQAHYFASAAGFEAAGERPERSTRDPRQQTPGAKADEAPANHPRPKRGAHWPRPLARIVGAVCRWLGFPVPLGARRHYVPWVYDRALRRHALKPYHGPLLIFHGADTTTDTAGHILWQRIGSGPVETECFDALHTEFVRNPAVIDAWTQRLAERFRARAREPNRSNTNPTPTEQGMP